MKIAVYAIAKNEEKMIERFLKSMDEADRIIILDTGSTDNTVALGRIGYGNNHPNALVRIFNASFNPFRFDDARNAALALVPDDVDLCLCMDMDETCEPGWRRALESVWEPGVTRVMYPFVSSHNPDGSPACSFSRDKCHARHGYRWSYPVHECVAMVEGAEKRIQCNGLKCHHWPDSEKPRSYILPLLESAVKEKPTDARMLHYLGREYMYQGRYTDAINYLIRQVEGPGWPIEQAEAMRFLGRMFPDDYRKEYWFKRACTEDPNRRDQWVDLSWFYYEKKNWTGCLYAARQALAITNRYGFYMTYDDAWNWRPEFLEMRSMLGMEDISVASLPSDTPEQYANEVRDARC